MRRIVPGPPAELDRMGLHEAYEPDRTRPSVRLNFVTSLDGAVAVNSHSRGLSSDTDRAVFSLLREQADAVMVGAGTLRHEGYGAVQLAPEQRSRRAGRGMPEDLVLVVVSGALSLSPDSPVFAAATVRPVLLTRADAPSERIAALRAVADVVIAGAPDADGSSVDLAVGLAALRERGLAQILCEGGPHLFGSLLAAGLVDELCLTISPLLAGPGAGRIVAGPTLPAPAGMRLVHLIEHDSFLFSRYARR